MRGIDKIIIDLYLQSGFTMSDIADLTPVVWSPYTFGGKYIKTFYDIKDKDGNYYYECYPNAGQFRVSLKNGGHRTILVKDIIEFRVSP